MGKYRFEDTFNVDELMLIRQAIQCYHEATDRLLETEVNCDMRVKLFERKFITENLLQKSYNISEVHDDEE